VITSVSNSKVKSIRALRQRKHRDATGLLFVEGLRAFEEGLDLSQVEAVLASPDLLDARGRRIVEQAERQGVETMEMSERVFRTLSGRDTPDGIGALVRQRWHRLSETAIQADDVWVVLHEIRDPRNVGAVLRVADAVGAAGVVLLDDAVDPYSPEAVRASTGAVFYQRLARASLEDFDAWRRGYGAACVGTSADAEADYREVRYPRPMVLLMGSERGGLNEAHESLCDFSVQIPMAGRVSSLNLAVASAVVLYEVYYQGRGAP
jgi:RNA methyltransferase, TrmH family